VSIVLPVGIDLPRWAASLFADFPSDNIPGLTDPDDWQAWGSRLIESPTFSEAGAPSPYLFPEWQSWALAVVRSLNA
jgi:hypothetical protein